MARQEVKKQLPLERVKNFLEVSLGFSEEQALEEAGRCLNCNNPLCVKGCPVEIDIPAFIQLIKEKKYKQALAKIKEKNNLPAICGRVCPQEDQCESACVLAKKKVPINIGALERFASDFGEEKIYSQPIKEPTLQEKIKIAVVGSGPAGLTAAADLAKIGYFVRLFESLHLAGGVLRYGIPEFRLPKDIVERELAYIRSLGVDIRTDVLIGSTYSIKDLFNLGFRAVFLGLGAGLPQFLGIEGENLPGVYSANEFLTRINLMKAHQFPEYATPIKLGKKVAVIGAGNVAFDCARCAVRLAKQVIILYRRTEEEMPARKEEIANAKEEGVEFRLLTQPKRIIKNQENQLRIECLRMELGSPDESGRRRPVEQLNSNFFIEVDNIIVAIGQSPNPLLAKLTPELKTHPRGMVMINDDYMTSIPGVFAAGDIVSGADTVISAMGAAKRAVQSIDKFIKYQDKYNTLRSR